MIGTNGEYRLTAEMLEALRPMMEAQGIAPPDVVNLVPKVNLGTPIRTLASQLGQLLAKSGLYRYGPNGQLRAMRLGRFEPMTPVWFTGWVERHVQVVKTYRGAGGGSYDAEVTMGKDVAAKLLEQEELLRELPRLRAVLPVRVPVPRKNGAPELCKIGYDEEAEIYCTNELEYRLDLPVEEAGEIIAKKYCSGFPFADKKEDLWQCRSFLVHVAAMLGVFGRMLMPPGTVRPLIFVMANDQGSGKSLLVSMQLAPCFGLAASADLPLGPKGINPEKFTALLETVAQSNKEILWLDDVPHNVWSNSLNRFVTAPGHEGRKYGSNDELFEAANVTQVFMTGNMPEATRDLMQRALVCELFMSQSSETVHHDFEMDANWLAASEQRVELLACLWAFLREWIAAKCPQGKTRHSRAPMWSRTIGGVLNAAGVEADPFAQPDLPVGGDNETKEWKLLLVGLADEAEDWVSDQLSKEREVDMKHIIEFARTNKLLVDLVGSNEDKPLKGGELKKLGRRLAKWRGHEGMRTSKGRRFSFGKRKQASNWVYPIVWLDPWQDAETED
ncbi:MAG: hypothetical protein JNJ83_11045 [Verrucomicrobiaceae bacterium]|nr:hypothetical protein [Verrucomicrobiaceae bacterium]